MLAIMIAMAFVGATVGAVFGARWHARRRGDATPELHQHPERLEQSLDPSDDA
jgi:hypothetical protein